MKKTASTFEIFGFHTQKFNTPEAFISGLDILLYLAKRAEKSTLMLGSRAGWQLYQREKSNYNTAISLFATHCPHLFKGGKPTPCEFMSRFKDYTKQLERLQNEEKQPALV